VNGVLIASIYLLKVNPRPGPEFAYKLAWFERLIGLAAEFMDAVVPAVLPVTTMSCRRRRTSGWDTARVTMLCCGRQPRAAYVSELALSDEWPQVSDIGRAYIS
jgi:hypothetical protein